MKKFFGHIKTVLVHKWWVFYYCCKFHIPWQGIVHDLSKFSITELRESLKFYQGGKSSPIPAAKECQGYSLAWQHHKGRNLHHYEYWVDKLDDGGKPIKMPFNYVLEMVADYLAAGRTYRGKNFKMYDELEWWSKTLEHPLCMNECTKNFVTFYFNALYHQFDNVTSRVVLKYFKKLYDINFYVNFSQGPFSTQSLRYYACSPYIPKEIKQTLKRHES